MAVDQGEQIDDGADTGPSDAPSKAPSGPRVAAGVLIASVVVALLATQAADADGARRLPAAQPA